MKITLVVTDIQTLISVAFQVLIIPHNGGLDQNWIEICYVIQIHGVVSVANGILIIYPIIVVHVVLAIVALVITVAIVIFYGSTTISISVDNTSQSVNKTWGAGVVLRATSVDAGYFIGITPFTDVVVSRINGPNCWTTITTASISNTNLTCIHKIEIEAWGIVYNVYFDQDLVFENVILDEYTNGSFGLVTMGAKATFYSVYLEIKENETDSYVSTLFELFAFFV